MKRRITYESGEDIVWSETSQKYRKSALEIMKCNKLAPESVIGIAKHDKNIAKKIGQIIVQKARKMEKMRDRIKINLGINRTTGRGGRESTESYVKKYSPEGWAWSWVEDENCARLETSICYDYECNSDDRENDLTDQQIRKILDDFYSIIGVFPKKESTTNCYIFFDCCDTENQMLAYLPEHLDVKTLRCYMNAHTHTDNNNRCIIIDFWINI